MIIDVHTHAFPDRLAEKAIPALEAEGNIKAHLDGKISSLLSSMDKAGIDVSVAASIATKPGQFKSIADWSQKIASKKIIPFPSVYPNGPDALNQIEEVSRRGFRGIKLHPYYQKFVVDDENLFPLYQKVEEEGLILLFHAGFDIAFPRERIADPEKFIHLYKTFPNLKMILSHLGGWEDWEEAEKHIIGKPIYIDTSYSAMRIPRDKLMTFISNHPSTHILFGSDSPWGNQKEEIDFLTSLPLKKDQLQNILEKSAVTLLGEQ
jgi:uncharacterized protein